MLLTGATGYLGIHILNDLIVNYSITIICLVRDKNGIKAEQRLRMIYDYYFGQNASDALAGRVTIIPVDITCPNSLDNVTQTGLTVINCAANVKHFSADDDIETVNVESVRNLIAFCLRTKSRIIHISTLSIAGMSVNGFPSTRLSERDFYLGQNYSDNKYVYSKFIAEDLIFAAIHDNGLSAKIMRVGNLSPRSTDGKFQQNYMSNNHMAIYRAYAALGMVPYNVLKAEIEYSPIDEVARAILLLAETPRECVVFHPVNNNKQSLADVLECFKQSGINFRYVDDQSLNSALKQAMDKPEKTLLLRPLIAYNSNLGQQVKNVGYDCDYTTQILRILGHNWSATNHDYISRFVGLLKLLGYFDV